MVSAFIEVLSFSSVTETIGFFPIQILIFWMLRNNADAGRWSYFELGSPVMGIERTRPGVREYCTLRAFLKIILILAFGISIYWNPFIFVGYRNDRFFSHTNPYILNVTQQCRCWPMIIFRAWATCVPIRKLSRQTYLLSKSKVIAVSFKNKLWQGRS